MAECHFGYSFRRSKFNDYNVMGKLITYKVLDM